MSNEDLDNLTRGGDERDPEDEVSEENEWELSAEWKAEIERRVQEINEGKAVLIPGDEVFEQCRQRLREITYSRYDEGYFDGGPESAGYSEYSDSWIWAPIAEIILHLLKTPQTVLDWGCAKGYLIQRFVERGVNADGVEVSEYVRSQAERWIRGRIRIIQSPRTIFSDDSYDAVCSFETLEHVSEHDVPLVLEEMARIGRRYFFGSIFLEGQEGDDPTHICVRTREWWDEKFKEAGWVPLPKIVKRASRFPVFRTLGYQLFCYELKSSS